MKHNSGVSKRFLLITLALALAGTASAQNEADFTTEVLNAQSVRITKYTGAKTDVTIPAKIGGRTVTEIGEGAFWGCENLASVTIPDSLVTIGTGAFGSCKNLISVTIPKSVTTINRRAFYDCRNLASITVDSANTDYISENGVLFNKNKTVLVQYPAGKTGTTYTIPKSVRTIGDGAFWGCENPTTVTIPDSVTTIGDDAFNSCTNLATVNISPTKRDWGVFPFTNSNKLSPVSEAALRAAGCRYIMQ